MAEKHRPLAQKEGIYKMVKLSPDAQRAFNKYLGEEQARTGEKPNQELLLTQFVNEQLCSVFL